MGEIGAVAKLAQYTISLVADPLLATWRAKREIEADKIRAESHAEVMEILAVGEARAELAGQAVRELAEDPQGLAALIENEIDRRVESHFQKRVNNLAQIVARAERALPPGQVPDVEPDMAWTSSFSEAAQDISDEDMQEMWARVLAGEVEKPGSTSLKALAVLRELDQATARLFRRLCSMALIRSRPDGVVLDACVSWLGSGDGANALTNFGVSFRDLTILNEHALVISSYDVQGDFRSSIAAKTPQGWAVSQAFLYQGREWGLIPDDEHDSSQEFKVSGVLLSKAGQEIASAVELEVVPQYDQALRDYFSENGLRMQQIGTPV